MGTADRAAIDWGGRTDFVWVWVRMIGSSDSTLRLQCDQNYVIVCIVALALTHLHHPDVDLACGWQPCRRRRRRIARCRCRCRCRDAPIMPKSRSNLSLRSPLALPVSPPSPPPSSRHHDGADHCTSLAEFRSAVASVGGKSSRANKQARKEGRKKE